jgi:hypothetical protein
MHVAKHIRERLPIGQNDFKIFLNGSEMTSTVIPGKRFPVHFATSFGEINGEIILANIPPTQKNISEAGITIRVKNIAICKDLFGFEISHSIGISRLRGSVNADFLPITSSRDALILDSEEYSVFHEKMRLCLKEVINEIKNSSFRKENLQASRLLRDALNKIGRALKKNPGAFAETADPPLGEETFGTSSQQEGYAISKAQFIDSSDAAPSLLNGYPTADLAIDRKAKRRRHLSLANKAIVRRMQFRNLGIVCRMERYGTKYPPSFREQGIIYINIDHPLYKKQENNDSLLSMFIATLISKELALQKFSKDATSAFDFQTQLLTDAFKDVRKI